MYHPSSIDILMYIVNNYGSKQLVTIQIYFNGIYVGYEKLHQCVTFNLKVDLVVLAIIVINRTTQQLRMFRLQISPILHVGFQVFYNP